jgi:hypothetical protein
MNPEEIELKNRLIHLASSSHEEDNASKFLDLMKNTMERNIFDNTTISIILNVFYTHLNEHKIDLKSIVNKKLIENNQEKFILE